MMFSIFWGCTVGLYMNIDMFAGGRANFGIGRLMWDNLYEYGEHAPAATPFYQWIGSILLFGTFFQITLDAITLRMLMILEKTGDNSELNWHDQHKMAVLMYFAQAAFITGAFVAFFPYCVFGWAEWTCIDNVYMALPIVALFELPLMPHALWMGKFAMALFLTSPLDTPTPEHLRMAGAKDITISKATQFAAEA